MKSQTTEFIELGRKQAEMFNWNRPGIRDPNQTFINLLITGYAFRQIMVLAYKSLVGYKRIIPIEELPPEQKDALWDSTKEMAGGMVGKDKIIAFTQCLYTLEYYLQ